MPSPPLSTPARPTVCLHLAENSCDRDRPFAFLATLSPSSTMRQHVPLGRLLRATDTPDPAAEAVLDTLRQASDQCAELRWLVASGALFRPQRWSARQALRFLRAAPELEAAGLTVRVPRWWQAGARRRVVVHVQVRPSEPGTLTADHLLQLDVGLALDGAPLDAEERAAALAEARSLVQLRGEWVEVDGPALARLLHTWEETRTAIAGTGLTFAQGMRLLAGGPGDPAHPTVDPTANGTNTRHWQAITAAPELEARLAALRRPRETPARLPGLHGTLRPSQRVGVAWLTTLTELGLGACLADDMGLGKTIQVLALLLRTRRPGRPPSLVVVPTSVLAGWQAEARRFTPGLVVAVAHASAGADAYVPNRAPAHEADAPDVVLTTYGRLVQAPELLAHTWDIAVFDEAQALKNPATQRSRAARTLAARARVALTGTPIENRLDELWSLFEVLNPGLLGTLPRFRAWVASLDGDHAPLRRLVAPYLLRRRKSDPGIAPELPKKTTTPVWCGLQPRQAALYAAEVDRLARVLRTADPAARQGAVLAAITHLKLVCNHPDLLHPEGLPATADPSDSGKLLALTELATRVARRGERMLVFTQYRRMMPLLENTLAKVWGRPGSALHGGTSVAERARRVAAFQAPDGPPFFVLSLRAAGTGLNLTAAQHVVHIDRWWNPAVEDQATDRTHRIGQAHPVTVHPFVCRGTVEARIDRLLADKAALADDVLGATLPTVVLSDLSSAALLDLVRLDLDATTLGGP